MKKYLPFIFSLAFLLSFSKLQAQVACGSQAIKRWTGTGAPGDLANAQAGTPGNLFAIDGNFADWQEHITGPLNSAYTVPSPPTFQPNPFLSPVALGNIQFDGLKDSASSSPNYDRDRPQSAQRDLRYFAFTYDRANLYFFFRRPSNPNSQMAFYYFIDINVDGFMNNGEPVVKVNYNGNTTQMTMMYYVVNTGSNATAAGSYVPSKGNSMTATVNRTGTSTVSEWVIGSADGWSMPGSVAEAHSTQLTTLGTVGTVTEIFASSPITSTNNVGFAAEFALPWKYLKLYTGTSTPPPSPNTPLDYTKIFTWHESLDNGAGNNNTADDEDNAGGCCSGLAVSGSPRVGASSLFLPKPGGTPPFDYRVKINYHDSLNVNTLVFTNNFVIKRPKDANGNAIPASAVQTWVITGSKDSACDGTIEGSSVTFAYNSSLSSADSFVFIPQPSPVGTGVITKGLSPGSCFLVDISTSASWPPIKSVEYQFSFESNFNTNSQNCSTEPGAGQGTATGSGLPVKFTYFNAVRNGRDVKLTWQTATEENNAGFDVERLIGVSGWVKIGHISSQAQNGNSVALLNYEITDFNNTTRGISQYRLRQVDIDGRSAYSAIRSVRGDGQKGKTIVYPNPSNDGKVNVVFEDVNVIRDISLVDMHGRTIRTWKSVSNNTIQIDNLVPGFYTVRIVNTETGEQDVEKIIVNKR